MRAITGVVVSSEPCSLRTASFTLKRFSKSAASHLPSSDCDTYLRSMADAVSKLRRFRGELGARYQRGAASFDARDDEELVEGDRKHQDESEGDMVVPAGGSHRDSAAEEDLVVASGKKKGKKKNVDLQEDRAVGRADLHIPASREVIAEKRKKEKHPNKEIIVYVKQESSLVVTEDLVSEKKSKTKKEKDHVKLEEYGNEVEEKIINGSAGGAEQRVASREKKRKKNKHEQEGVTKDVKEEETITDGGPDRERKRGRADNYDYDLEQVKHAKKKQKKHSD